MKNIKKPIFLTILLFFVCNFSFSQGKHTGVTLSNNTTGMPVIAYPDLFYSQFHPGIDAFYGWKLNNGEKNRIFVNANLGFYYHQFVQGLLRAYPTLVYERKLSDRFFLNAGLGGGLGVSFEGENAFALQEDGSYQNKALFGARTQYLIELELGLSYSLFKNNLNSPMFICQFRSFMQGTYVNSYVPLLPLNSINLGIRMPIKNSAK